MDVIAQLLEQIRAEERQNVKEIEQEVETTLRENILEYASKHMGESYSIAEMARQLNSEYNETYNLTAFLLKKKLLPKGFNGYAYSKAKCAQKARKLEMKPGAVIPVPEKHNCQVVADEVDRLAWEYLKTKKGMFGVDAGDVINFVNYVKEKSNG